jgi:hypothetical protein
MEFSSASNLLRTITRGHELIKQLKWPEKEEEEEKEEKGRKKEEENVVLSARGAAVETAPVMKKAKSESSKTSTPKDAFSMMMNRK